MVGVCVGRVGDEDAMETARQLAKLEGFKLQGPAPTPLPTTVWADAKHAVEDLAKKVDDNGGCYIVPAFSGLFAPYWKSDARGAIVGLSRFNTNAHVARATLEAICYQSRDVVQAMCSDSGVGLGVLNLAAAVAARTARAARKAWVRDMVGGLGSAAFDDDGAEPQAGEGQRCCRPSPGRH